MSNLSFHFIPFMHYYIPYILRTKVTAEFEQFKINFSYNYTKLRLFYCYLILNYCEINSHQTPDLKLIQ
jgi:hypothetical protein